MCCSNCNQSKPIVNKKYDLCDDCNFMRLHNGQSKSEVYSQRNKDKPVKTYTLPIITRSTRMPSQKALKQQTPKQKEVQQLLHALKATITLDAIQSDQYYCKGCGNAGGKLDCSHILSVKHRKDLELVKENINLMCRDCHMDWESGNILKMLNLICFEADFVYIKANDPGRYNKLLDAIIYLMNHLDVLQPHLDVEKKARRLCDENDFIFI